MDLADVIDEINTIIRPQTGEKSQTFDIVATHIYFEHLLGEMVLALVEAICSDQALAGYCEFGPVISPSRNVEVDCVDALKPLNDRINEGFYVLGANANMNVEQWGNICLIVRELLNGSSVDDCMAMFDALHAEFITE